MRISEALYREALEAVANVLTLPHATGGSRAVGDRLALLADRVSAVRVHVGGLLEAENDEWARRSIALIREVPSEYPIAYPVAETGEVAS